MMIFESALISILVAAAAVPQTPVTIIQKTTGWCSPVIANVIGNVTVNCIGVDPRALKRLNDELNRKNLELADKIREADEWTNRYKELETRLSEAGDDTGLSRQAEEYLHEGELEKAGTILDQILGKEEKQIDQTASNHYNRALVFELQFLPLLALPHSERAYRYRPEEPKYSNEYVTLLFGQNDFKRAEPVFLTTLDNARQLAQAHPAAYQPLIAETLNTLADLYRFTQRMKEAEAAYKESLDIGRRLAKVDLGAGDVDDQSCDLHDSSMHRLPPTRLSVNPKMGTEAGLGESWECGLPDSRARRLSVELRPSRSSGPVRGARFV